MAQNQTNLSGQVSASGGPPSGMLKIGAISVQNTANETSIAINWATFGINTVIAWGMEARDANTVTAGAAQGRFANLVSTTVTYTWVATDIADILVWALGY